MDDSTKPACRQLLETATLETWDRGQIALRWLDKLQGKKIGVGVVSVHSAGKFYGENDQAWEPKI